MLLLLIEGGLQKQLFAHISWILQVVESDVILEVAVAGYCNHLHRPYIHWVAIGFPRMTTIDMAGQWQGISMAASVALSNAVDSMVR